MKSKLSFVVAVLSGVVATTGTALANGMFVPEPGTLALVGVAVAALIAVSRRGRK